MKQSLNTKINLFFSAFLITAFVICSYFFADFSATFADSIKVIINCVVFAIFGVLLFYATRIGDGAAVKRFSLVTLLALDLPALVIIIIAAAPGLPLHAEISANGIIPFLAAVALGYGLPYTFFSGFEILVDAPEDTTPLEGGVLSDILSEAETEESEEASEEVTEEMIDEATEEAEEAAVEAAE
jgi:hypothetical protein